MSGVATARGASGSGNNYFVSTSGQDSGNACVNHLFPCQTIGHALVEEGLFGGGGTIHLAKGTYTGQVTVEAQNSSVTIVGASAKKTIIQPPTSSLTSVSDPNSVSPVHAVIEVSGRGRQHQHRKGLGERIERGRFP